MHSPYRFVPSRLHLSRLGASLRGRLVYQLSWSTSLYCVNFKGCTRLINSTGTLPSQRMLMFARPRLDIVEPLHIPVHLVPLSYETLRLVAQEVGHTFRNHNGRSVGIGPHHIGHHRGIGNAQAFETIHPAILVDHRQG